MTLCAAKINTTNLSQTNKMAVVFLSEGPFPRSAISVWLKLQLGDSQRQCATMEARVASYKAGAPIDSSVGRAEYCSWSVLESLGRWFISGLKEHFDSTKLYDQKQDLSFY